ncbi:MAG: hypothetical protein NZ518_10780, partial [Dehalococcoidia bacterium]|nr:hypothetical protein [Dehalococcoidia bacterium]
AESARVCRNVAHDYMPHVTLTSFFTDQPDTAPIYRDALATALAKTRLPPNPIVISEWIFTPDWHGMAIDSVALRDLTDRFVETRTPTLAKPLAAKTWLHLSLAYGFPADQHQPLKAVADRLLSRDAPVGWALRLYERHSNGWTLHGEWTLATPTPAP